MATTDRELLEAAAKAGAIEGRYFESDNPIHTGIYRAGRDYYWNPLISDSEAFRLSVQCGIETSIVDDEPGRDGRFSRACAGYATEADPRVRYVFEDHGSDLFAAMRRAIVRAAAAMAT